MGGVSVVGAVVIFISGRTVEDRLRFLSEDIVMMW